MLLAVTPARAQIANGSFEDDYAGWTLEELQVTSPYNPCLDYVNFAHLRTPQRERSGRLSGKLQDMKKRTRLTTPENGAKGRNERIPAWNRFRWVLAVVLAVRFFMVSFPAHAAGFTIIDLGLGVANGINNSGQVVGFCSSTGHAFLWSSESGMRDLGTLPGGSTSVANGINSSGQVVGSSGTSSGADHAFLWSDGAMLDLGTLPFGNVESRANGINSFGQVVGQIVVGAFLWSSESGMRDVGALPGGNFSIAQGINDSGQVVGVSTTLGPFRAFLWSSTSGIQDLGTLGGGVQLDPALRGALGSQANAINSFGQVVGFSDTPSGPQHAFLWSGVMIDLGALGGSFSFDSSFAIGINNRGQVVGTDRTLFDPVTRAIVVRAFLWSGGVMTDLSTLPEVRAAGWSSLSTANAINDAGQIVGAGAINGQGHAFLLSPPLSQPCLTGGGERAAIIAQYQASGVIDTISGQPFVPACDDFTQSADTQFFSFGELNVQNTFAWALLRTPMLAPASSGYGLDQLRTVFGGSRIISSAYRTPLHNAAVGGTPSSRHLFGDAADLFNETGSLEEWTEMYQAAQTSHASYIEPLSLSGLAHVHADWRSIPGPYATGRTNLCTK
jgi:probable HAF family extracellular repeat protein